MEKSEQGFVVKFFFAKGLRSKEIHRKVTAVPGPPTHSLALIKE
jgi:hypothetical protein